MDSLLTSKTFITSVLFVVAALICLAIVEHIQRGMQKKEADMAVKTGAFVRTVFRVLRGVIILLTVLAVLQVNDVNISSLIAGLGIASAVVGLAMQDVLKDVLMGFHILSDHSFAVGDVIKINEDEGVVTDFTLLTTKYRSINSGDEVILCNRNITQVARSGEGRYLSVYLPQDGESRQAEAALERAAELLCADAASASQRKSEPAVIRDAKLLGFKGYDQGRYAYSFYYVCDPRDHWAAERAAWTAIRVALEEAGLTVAAPEVDLQQS